MRMILIAFAATLLLAHPLRAQADNSARATAAHAVEPTGAPLFGASETLALVMEAPMRSLLRMQDRDNREWLDGKISYTDDDGVERTIPVRVSTRGRFRLKECQFPPIRVDFRRGDAEGTVFDGQDRLKLVTHCNSRRDEFEQFILQEYLIYRMYGEFTEKSYRVRLARITYVDGETGRNPVTRYAFFIEDDEAMAARNERELMDQFPIVPPHDQDQATLNLVSVFQYMVGNSDWSAFQAPPGEERCCHNVRIIGSLTPPLHAVPYDFDWSGLISAPYARPAPELRIRSVRQRLYRGICGPREELDATLDTFREKREAIYALIDDQEGLTDRKKADTRRYIEEFYAILDDPRQVDRRIVRECRRT